MNELVDITLPAAISWMPQTWGWAVLGIVLGVATVVSLWRWRRHALANRYRKEALSVLATLEHQAMDPQTRGAAMVGVAALIKRTALAVFPREDVAPLFGTRWVEFIRAQDAEVSGEALAFLDDLEYQLDPSGAGVGGGGIGGGGIGGGGIGGGGIGGGGKPSGLPNASIAEADAKAAVSAARAWIKGHRVPA